MRNCKTALLPRHIFFVCAFFTGLLLASCSVTDVRPFAEQTDAMVKAVDGSQQATREVLGRAISPDSSISIKDYDKALSSTKAALNAILEYSKTLVALAESGAKGGKAAKTLGDSLNGVLGVFNAAIGGPVIALGAEIYGEVAKMRAQSSLAKAVEAAQGPVDTLAGLLSENFENLSDLALLSADEAIALNDENNELRVKYFSELRKQESLLLRRLTEWYRYTTLIEQARELQTLAVFPELATRASGLPQMQGVKATGAKIDEDNQGNEIRAYSVKDVKGRQEKLEDGAKSVLSDLVDVDPVLAVARSNTVDDSAFTKILADRIVDLQESLEFVRREIAFYNDTFQEYQSTDMALKKLKTSTTRALKASKKAVNKWALAHTQLKVAIEDDRRLSIVEFATAVKDIYAAYGELGRVEE